MATAALVAAIALSAVLSGLAWRKAILDRRDPQLLPGDRVLTYVLPWVPTVGALWLLVTLIRG
jgi:hypothetical protein